MENPEHHVGEIDPDVQRDIADEFRRIAEMDEYAARKSMLRSRSLEDVAYDLLTRGDTVQLSVAEQRFVGTLAHAQGDLATVETADGDIVHINLQGPVAMRVTRRSTEGGKSRDLYAPNSFIARLRQLELQDAKVVMSVPGIGETIVGHIEAVTRDHVMFVDLIAQVWYVPLKEIATVALRRGPSRTQSLFDDESEEPEEE